MSHWPMVPLSEVLQLQRRWVKVEPHQCYREIGIRSFGKGIFHKTPVEGIALGNKRVLRIEPGDLVFNNVFAWEGAVAVAGSAEAGMIGSHRFVTYTVDPRKSTSDFLMLFFSIKQGLEILRKASPGSAGRNRTLGLDRFMSQSVPLPPLADQRRIVDRIRLVSSMIQEAKGLRQLADALAGSLLGQFIRVKFEQGKRSGWPITTLGKYVVESAYGTSEKTSDDSTGLPIIRMGNIQDGSLVFNDLKYLHPSASDLAKLLLRRDDILVNRTNSAELVGKCAVFDVDGQFGFASYIIRLRLDTAIANPQLVAHYINSPIGRAYMLSEKKQMTGQANINGVKLRAMPIWLPDRTEQDELVRQIEHFRRNQQMLRGEQKESALALNALLPSILDHAFRGEL